MKQVYFFLIITIISTSLSAQNIVQNGSFEEVEGKIKNPGEVFLAPPWKNGTAAVPDLYSPKAKDDAIKVPVNAYGEQKPKDGTNYAGILIYSNREAEPRSYLTQKLKYPMLADEHYCVKFHISFADLSKYASNNIGCYISKDSLGSETDLILDHKPQIINSTNRIFEKQWDWEDICRIYVAEGGEQYMAIGNFGAQDETRVISVKRPREFTQSQLRDGYYFIDNISITPNATPENCKCEPGSFAFANLDKEEASFKTAEEDIPDQVIIGTTETLKETAAASSSVHEDVVIGFQLGKSNLSSTESASLTKVASFLKENPDVKIKLVGHTDKSEAVMKDLSGKRISQVSKYLMSKGVASSKIETSDVADGQPIDDSGSKEKRHMNMVVEIQFSK